MSLGIQMAIDEQPTVTFAGTTYELRYLALDGATVERGGWDPAQEERNARAAIAEHDCIAYIGTYNSGAAKISMPILNRAQMLMISPGNTYPGLTKPGTGIGDEPWIYSPLGSSKRNFCRVVPADDLQGPAAARYAANVLGIKTVYVFHDTETYGRSLAEYFTETAKEEGLTIVNGSPTGVGLRTPNNSVVSDIQQLNPDLVYFGGTFIDMGEGDQSQDPVARIYNGLRDVGYQGYFMGADGLAEDKFLAGLNLLNESDENLLATLVVLPPTELNELGQTFASNYRREFGDEPNAFAAPSYEAAKVVIRGLESVPETISPTEQDFMERARPALLTAVRTTTDYNGVLGTWGFDANCDTTNTTISINQASVSESNQVGHSTFQFIDVIE